MTRRLASLMTAALVVALLPGVANASVATSCSFDPSTATVTAIIGSGDNPTLVRNGTAIAFGGSDCGAATVTNTDQINVDAPDTNTTEGLTISLAGGTFLNGGAEIGIWANLAETEPITFIGTSGADDFLIRAERADLNADVTSTSQVTYPIGTRTVTVDAGDGADTITTKTYVADVSGGDGADTLNSMDAGPSAYDGGPGDDTVSYTAGSDSASGVQVHATDGTDATVDRGNQVIDHTAGIETIVGTSGNDRFYGSGDADHFVGGGGIDWFLPQGGDDVIDGGGDLGDTLSVAASLAPVTIDMTNQQATGEGTDTFAGVDVLVGSPGDDTFIGDPEAHDIVNIEGGGGRDTLDLSAAATGQSVYLSNSYPPAWLWAADISRVIGSPYRDRFFFSAGSVPAHFAGREGNDRLQGGPLDDTLKGGPGDDRILGKGGTDTCVGGPGSDTITGCELP